MKTLFKKYHGVMLPKLVWPKPKSEMTPEEVKKFLFTPQPFYHPLTEAEIFECLTIVKSGKFHAGTMLFYKLIFAIPDITLPTPTDAMNHEVHEKYVALVDYFTKEFFHGKASVDEATKKIMNILHG